MDDLGGKGSGTGEGVKGEGGRKSRIAKNTITLQL